MHCVLYMCAVRACVQPCRNGTSTRLTCVIPDISLPAEFRNLSDPSLTFPHDNDSPPSRRRSVTSYNGRNSTLDFTQSVMLDGVAYRWNESYDFRFISLMPTIEDSGHLELNAQPINIKVCKGTGAQK